MNNVQIRKGTLYIVKFLLKRAPGHSSNQPMGVPLLGFCAGRRGIQVSIGPCARTTTPRMLRAVHDIFLVCLHSHPFSSLHRLRVLCAILWEIECDAYMHYVAADIASGEDPNMCSYYEWWLYIVGNLVGVSVANVTVNSDHPLLAILDLLISVWSLAVAGLVVGLLGSLSWVHLIAQSADSRITGGFEMAFGCRGVVVGWPAGATGSLEGSQFLEEINLEVAHLRELYDHAHRDKNGSVNADEVERLLTKLHSKVKAFDASTSGMQSLTARMDTLEAKIDMIIAKLDISSKVAGAGHHIR